MLLISSHGLLLGLLTMRPFSCTYTRFIIVCWFANFFSILCFLFFFHFIKNYIIYIYIWNCSLEIGSWREWLKLDTSLPHVLGLILCCHFSSPRCHFFTLIFHDLHIFLTIKMFFSFWFFFCVYFLFVTLSLQFNFCFYFFHLFSPDYSRCKSAPWTL